MKVFTSDDAERRAWDPYEKFCTEKNLDPMSVGSRHAYEKYLSTQRMGERTRTDRIRLIRLIQESGRIP